MSAQADPRISTGIAGLDEIMEGGIIPERMYLIQGHPGAGKTTLAFKFLLAGSRSGERGLYITLSETEIEIRAVAESHGWSLEGIDLLELSADNSRTDDASQNTLFFPSEVELGETMRRVLETIDRVRPARIVFDSLSELRMLAQTPLRFRREILALKQYLATIDTTALVIEDMSIDSGDLQLQSLAHGVITLTQVSPMYGADRRRIRVVKFRGSKFLGGMHDFRIETGGIRVFPRLVAVDYPRMSSSEKISSGNAEIDSLLGGGLDFGTSTLLLGPAGTGKSTLAMLYGYEAAKRGEKTKFFLFEEGLGTFFGRAKALGMDLFPLLDKGEVIVQHIDPAEILPGEFASQIRDAVEQDHVRMVVVDSVSGYINAMLDENYLLPQLHELLNYLRRRNIVIILVLAQHGLIGPSMSTAVDVSYLADTVVQLRHFEADGNLRKAISVIKKRGGIHEKTLRRLRIGPVGIQAGEPLFEYHGLLTGTPTYIGENKTLPRGGDEQDQ